VRAPIIAVMGPADASPALGDAAFTVGAADASGDSCRRTATEECAPPRTRADAVAHIKQVVSIR